MLSSTEHANLEIIAEFFGVPVGQASEEDQTAGTEPRTPPGFALTFHEHCMIFYPTRLATYIFLSENNQT